MATPTFDKTHTPSKWWRPVEYGWQYFGFALVFVAVVVTIGIGLMPEESEHSRVAEAVAHDKARQERIRSEPEDLGIFYIEPGTNPFPTKPPTEQ